MANCDVWAAALSYKSRKQQSKKDSKDQESIQVSHLSKDTKLESNKITIDITNNSQDLNPFPSGDHKAVMNRRESMTNTRHK